MTVTVARARAKQYIVRALGCAIAITFDAAEEARVKIKASRGGFSVEDLIVKAINDKAGRERWSSHELYSLIREAINELGSARKR
jgi:hypothetical protein